MCARARWFVEVPEWIAGDYTLGRRNRVAAAAILNLTVRAKHSRNRGGKKGRFVRECFAPTADVLESSSELDRTQRATKEAYGHARDH